LKYHEGSTLRLDVEAAKPGAEPHNPSLPNQTGKRYQTMSSENGNATVKMFDGQRGYGFCKHDENFDVFFHLNDLRRSGLDDISAGTRVYVEHVDAEKGPKAKSIRLAD
jgi:CspA family cold shock protein